MARGNRIKKFFNADRIAALFFLVLVALYGWQSTQFSTALEVDVVGPSFFPRILAVFGLVLGILLLIGRADETSGGGNEGTPSQLVAMTPAALLLGYVLVLEPVGFPIATVVFLAATFRYLGYPSWKGALLLAAIITAVIFGLFYIVLDLRLPLGVLGGLR
jgi:putative tricarboxylic transport membrane protein